MNIKKIVSLFLILIIVGTFPVFAGSVSTYDVLIEENDQFVVRLSEGGLSNVRINEFLTDFDNQISTLKVPERRKDIEIYFLTFLFNIVLEDENYADVCIVFDNVFQEEFAYMMDNDMAIPEAFERFFIVAAGDLIKEEPEIFYEEPMPEEEMPEDTEDDSIKKETEKQPDRLISDIYGYEWAEEYIENLFINNIMNGYEDKTFRPGNFMTRAEALKIICKSFLKSGYVVIKSEFEDIDKEKWYYKNVVNAEYYSLFYDIYEKKFEGDKYITRQEFCTLAYRAYVAKNGAMKTKNPGIDFFDISNISNYAYKSIVTMQKAGIINGDNMGNFNPKDNIKRAEAAKIIYLLLNYHSDK